jgi:hypothetical protein
MSQGEIGRRALERPFRRHDTAIPSKWHAMPRFVAFFFRPGA